MLIILEIDEHGGAVLVRMVYLLMGIDEQISPFLLSCHFSLCSLLSLLAGR